MTYRDIVLKHPVYLKPGEYLYISENEKDGYGHAIKLRHIKDIKYAMDMRFVRPRGTY